MDVKEEIENAFYLKKKGTELLKDLKKVPACEDKIQTEWHGFRKGTDIHDIYRCIESVYKAGVALDV